MNKSNESEERATTRPIHVVITPTEPEPPRRITVEVTTTPPTKRTIEVEVTHGVLIPAMTLNVEVERVVIRPAMTLKIDVERDEDAHNEDRTE